MARISVIIVNYNSGARLKRCLDALDTQTFKDFETIIVDNASTDGSASATNETALAIKLIQSEDNLGFAVANNNAAKVATGEWIAFLNPDAYARADWLEQLIAATTRYPNIDAFGSTQRDAVDPKIIDGAGDVYHALGLTYRAHNGKALDEAPPDHGCFSPCAAAMMIRKTSFQSLGGFDEGFFCYGEDVDLGFRLRLAGGTAIQLRDAVVLHEGSGVTGRYSEFTVYHGNRNRIWLTYKNMPALLYFWLGPVQLAINFYLLIRYTMIGRGRVYARALWDGYGGLWQMASLRRSTQSKRRATTGDIARAITWSPLKAIRRQARQQPVE